MVKLGKDCIESKTLCDNGRIFRRNTEAEDSDDILTKDKIYML